MDIAKTMNLLQSQIQSNQKATPFETRLEELDISDISTDAEQSTGEEFSTFLTLLTAQIKNQDPLAPLDSTQFVEQLATFSNLELQAKSNQSLELIAALLVRQIEILTPTTQPDSTTPQTNLDTSLSL